MADDTMATPLGVAAPQPGLGQELQEGIIYPPRGGAVSWGFLSGWLAAGVCDFGIVPGVLSGFGMGSAYANSTILGGMGWTPVVGVFAIALVFGVSYLLTRRVFATRPREVALQTYWRVVRTTSWAAGISFVAWTVLGMTIIYAVGGG